MFIDVLLNMNEIYSDVWEASPIKHTALSSLWEIRFLRKDKDFLMTILNKIPRV